MINNAPIGIFDSGIGGLTVANAIKNVLPNESIVYFGDTKHLPYGEKSTEAIIEYSTQISKFLIQKKCKMIIIACNTASSVAYESVKKTCPSIKVINVIDPIVDYISQNKSTVKIGVIGTKRTIKSNIYQRKINASNKHISVKSLATPLLAPMIEEGFVNDSISKLVVHNYLNNEKLAGIEKIILACTHYPLIEKIIASFYKNNIEIIDSANQVAEKIKSYLTEKEILSKTKAQHHFYVSDYTESFEQSAKVFFDKNLALEKIKLKP